MIDALLGPRIRAYPPDELRRARLILGVDLLLAVCAFFYSGVLLVTVGGEVFIPDLLAAGVVLVGNAWMLRRTGILERGAFAMAFVILGVVIAASWQQGGMQNNVFIWGPMACVIAMILSGPRFGWFCVTVEVAHLSLLYLAERSGHVYPKLIQDPTAVVASQLAAALFTGAFAWFYDRTRREALAARDQALVSLEEGREARLALVENINAVIYSVDPQLRLIAGNSLFTALSHKRGEAPILPGQPVLGGLAESQHDDLRALFARALGGEHFCVERRLELRSGTLECEVWFNPIRRASGEVRAITVLGRDIGERKRAQAELERLNQELARAAHLAGKAEVAIDVLHNVGNGLTGINGNADVLIDRLRSSKTPFLAKAIALLPTEPSALAHFLTADEKGLQLRDYLGKLAETLEQERSELLAEVGLLRRQLDHVKSVVARQQAFARPGGVIESAPLAEVISEALNLSDSSLKRHGIEVISEVDALPSVALDRHRLTEILTNFIVNSRQSLDASHAITKRIAVHAFQNEKGALQIDVTDTGIGIAPEQCKRLFAYGFTTKPDGHGFGLAGSLLAARSMGGTAYGRSDGPGRGATFTVELPLKTTAANPSKEHAA